MTDLASAPPRRTQLRGAAARALSPLDLRAVSVLLDRDPATWTVEEARTVRAIQARAGEAAQVVLRELGANADRVLAVHDQPYRPLLDEHRAISDELGRVSNHDVFGRHLARDQVARTIRETEQQLREEVRERFRPVFATALNAEHSNKIAAQMQAELAKVAATVSAMHRDSPRIEAEQAQVISRQRQQERETRDRALCLRRSMRCT